MKARNSGIHLTAADAAIVKGMLARRDRQHDIAAWFGVNGGRIAEIATGHTFGGVVAQTTDLPPKGPYLSGRGVQKARAQLVVVKQTLTALAAEVDELIEELDRP